MFQFCSCFPKICLAIPADWQLQGDAEIMQSVLELEPVLLKATAERPIRWKRFGAPPSLGPTYTTVIVLEAT